MLGLNPSEQEVVDMPNEIARFVIDVMRHNIEGSPPPPYHHHHHHHCHYPRTIFSSHRKGLIYFPDFCDLALERFREGEAADDNFRKTIFKVWTRTTMTMS